MSPLQITVSSRVSHLNQDAKKLAEHLSLPFTHEHGDLSLCYTEQGLCLLDWRHGKKPISIQVDFVNGKANHRRQFGGGRNQPLARALGLKPGLSPPILDTTAGMGRDSFVVATLGCEVTLLERQPITHALLADGLSRATLNDNTQAIASRMTLHHRSGLSYLSEHAHEGVIYLDPMYPHKDKSAQVKKEMAIFRDIAGDDEDAGELLKAALDSKAARVVVKRPKGAPYLGDIETKTCVESKNTRYDIYGLRKL